MLTYICLLIFLSTLSNWALALYFILGFHDLKQILTMNNRIEYR